jgi:hypothetical protein
MGLEAVLYWRHMQTLIRNWYIPGGGHLHITEDLKIDYQPPSGRKSPRRFAKPKRVKRRPVWEYGKKVVQRFKDDWFDHEDIKQSLKVTQKQALKVLQYLHEHQYTVRRWETEGFVYQLVPQP